MLTPGPRPEWDRLVGRTRCATATHQPRSRGACRLLRRLRALSRSNGADREIRRPDQVPSHLTSPSPTARPGSWCASRRRRRTGVFSLFSAILQGEAASW